MTALQSLSAIIHSVNNAIEPLITDIVKGLSSCLASSSTPIRDSASEALETLSADCDTGILIQPYVQVAQYGNIRVKAAMIPHICQLVAIGFDGHQKAIIKYVLPFAVTLLAEKKGGLQNTAADLFQTLSDTFGPALNQHMPTLTEAQRQAMAQLIK